MRLRIGEVVHDLTARPLVVGILKRTADSFYDGGAYPAMDAFLERAALLAAEGADLLEVGGRPGGVGIEEVAEAEEIERVTTAVRALRARFDVPVAVDTWRGAVVEAGLEAGADLANDMSGFRDPTYLPAVAAAGACVVATHIRLSPGVPDPDPVYDDVVEDVAESLAHARGRAERVPQPLPGAHPAAVSLQRRWRSPTGCVRHR